MMRTNVPQLSQQNKKNEFIFAQIPINKEIDYEITPKALMQML